jgi:hypothetical protein
MAGRAVAPKAEQSLAARAAASTTSSADASELYAKTADLLGSLGARVKDILGPFDVHEALLHG